MRLLTIEEVQRGLDAEFLPLEPGVTGLRLIPGGTLSETLEEVQDRLNVRLPEPFRRIVTTYDLGNLAIGPVSFCGHGDYMAELLELNEKVNWWGPGERPGDQVMVANSDPYVFLLNVVTGRVSAFDRQHSWREAVNVAEDFERFVRGLGTVMLLRNQQPHKQDLGEQVAEAVGAADQEFWLFLAR